MFNLEQSIAGWRKQMLAAGIKTPVLLEELESHLRDDMEQQIRSGTGAHEAFQAAVRQIGPAAELKNQFQIANPNQRMKKNLINLLVIIAVLATGMGLILPGVAKWRARETFDAFSIVMPLIGVTIFAWGVVWGTRGIFVSLKARHKA